MDEREFRRLLHNGRGRAIQYARANDASAFRDTILDACLRCYSADADVEGTRSGYMLDLVRGLPDFAFYRGRVLDELSPCGDDWNSLQRFCFAASLAIDGDFEARAAINDAFDPGPLRGEAHGVALAAVEGLAGFLHAASKIGALILAGVPNIDMGFLHSWATNSFGDETVDAALDEAARRDKATEAYRAEARRREEPRRKPVAEDPDRAARELLVETDPDALLRILRVFARSPFPLDPAALVELASNPDSRLAWAAARALARISHPEVRRVALEWISSGSPLRAWVLEMIDRNYREGDRTLAMQWFEAEADRDILHSMGMGLRNIWKRHPDTATEVPMLLACYEKGPCSMCREFVVRRLIELGALPESIRAECAHDASDEVRDLVTPSA